MIEPKVLYYDEIRKAWGEDFPVQANPLATIAASGWKALPGERFDALVRRAESAEQNARGILERAVASEASRDDWRTATECAQDKVARLNEALRHAKVVIGEFVELCAMESGRARSTGEERWWRDVSRRVQGEIETINNLAFAPPHASDCALHRAPAYPPGPCNCRQKPPTLEPRR